MQYNTLWCIILHFKPSATSLQPNKLPPPASGKSVIQKRPAEYMFCRTSLNVSDACQAPPGTRRRSERKIVGIVV